MNLTTQNPPAAGEAAHTPSTITNCHGQRVHPDAMVILSEKDRRSFGGARFIDAETFVKNRPLAKLVQSFVAGQWMTQDTQEGVVMDVPAAYAANGWRAGK